MQCFGVEKIWMQPTSILGEGTTSVFPSQEEEIKKAIYMCK